VHRPWLLAAATAAFLCGPLAFAGAPVARAAAPTLPPAQIRPGELLGEKLPGQPCAVFDKALTDSSRSWQSNVRCRGFRIAPGWIGVTRQDVPDGTVAASCVRRRGSVHAIGDRLTPGALEGIYYKCRARNRGVVAEMLGDTLRQARRRLQALLTLLSRHAA